MGFLSIFNGDRDELSDWEVVDDFLNNSKSLIKIWKIQFLATIAMYLTFIVISIRSQRLILSAADWVEGGDMEGFTMYLGILSITSIFTLSTVNAYYTWKIFRKAIKAEKKTRHIEDVSLEIKKIKHLLVGIFIAAIGTYALVNIFKSHTDEHKGICPVIFFVGFAHISSTVLKGWLAKIIKTLCFLNTDNF